jgi:hypothetical protein
MIRLNPPYGIWTIWKELFLLPKLTFLCVSVLCIYSLWTTAAAIPRFVILPARSLEAEIAATKNAMAVLRERCTKLQELKGALFYLFGLVLFLNLQGAFDSVDKSKAPFEWLIMQNFLVVFAFGANVFFLFALIHLTLWFTSSRINAYMSKLSKQKP